MENRSPALLSRNERTKRSPILAAIQAEREREIAKARRWVPVGIAFFAVAMAINPIVIALFLNGRLM